MQTHSFSMNLNAPLFRLIMCFLLVGCDQSSPPPVRDVPKPAVIYSIIDEWRIPNGGYSRVIVTDVTQRSEAGLLALADQLRRDTRADRNAFVFIYDNHDAAVLRKAALAERLNKRDLKLHDDHMIGTYFRNANTGVRAVDWSA